MPDYDFTVLSPHEFECLCRDLLQKKENVYVESFKDGPDGGIDLRFADVKAKVPDGKQNKVVVQVKRYKDFNELLPTLRKEVVKARKLDQSGYYLMTSIGLTPANKDKIIELFSPHIKNSEDIFGRDDLNNLLGQFPDIEKQYYKLWLSSTNVLETILNKRYSVWTQIEKDEIERSIRLYVKNPCFDRALEILQKNRFVIISGIPGVGKTTLAQMLVNYLLANGYDEFVSIEGDLDAFAELKKEDKKQVFYFDDFLGANFLEDQRLNGNGKLLNMIEAIRRSADKLLILTTREYILQEAMQKYDRMKTNNLEVAKCILNLGAYTTAIRAGILYNHLTEANLPHAYIDSLLCDGKYLKLIGHSNFNPRVIEYFIGRGRWKECKPEDFVKTFTRYFDKPYSVWEDVFSNRPHAEQYALWVLLTMGQPVLLSDWKTAYLNFCRVAGSELMLTAESIVGWGKIIRNLFGTFVKTRYISNSDDKLVEFINPSIYDFLFSYDRSDDLSRLLIKGSCFIEQIYTIFGDKDNDCIWKIPDSLYNLVDQQISKITDEYKSCGTTKVRDSQLTQIKSTILQGLYECSFRFSEVNKNFHFVERHVSPALIKLDCGPFRVKCHILARLDWSKVHFQPCEILNYLSEHATSVFDYVWFIRLCVVLKSNILENADFADKFLSSFKDEADSCSDYDEAEGLIDALDIIRNLAPFIVRDEYFKSAEIKLRKTMEKLDHPTLQNKWGDRIVIESNSDVDEMFGCLKHCDI